MPDEWRLVSVPGGKTHLTNGYSPVPGIIRSACGRDMRVADIQPRNTRAVCKRCVATFRGVVVRVRPRGWRCRVSDIQPEDRAAENARLRAELERQAEWNENLASQVALDVAKDRQAEWLESYGCMAASLREALQPAPTLDLAEIERVYLETGHPVWDGHCWCQQPNLLDPNRKHEQRCLDARALLAKLREARDA